MGVFCYTIRMSWAARRRFLILLIIGAVITAFLTIILISVFYKSPSCTDGRQNQGESGIDCGGPCAYFCAGQKYPPTVLFTKAIQNRDGRTGVISIVENKNADAAAKNIQYRITLYGAGQSLIQQVTGTLDLPPGASVPVYIPNIASGKQKIVNSFLDIVAPSVRWFSMPIDERIIPTVSSINQDGTTSLPRITATLTNTSANALVNIKTIVVVHNEKGDVIAASATVMPIIYAQSNATATFTWNEAFSSTPAYIEVVPIVPLP